MSDTTTADLSATIDAEIAAEDAAKVAAAPKAEATPAKKAKAPAPVKVTLVDHREMLDTLSEWLRETDGEVTPELESLLAEASGGFEAKVIAVAAKIDEFETLAATAKERAETMAQRAKRFQAQADGLSLYLRTQMDLAEVPKVVGVEYTVAVRENPPKVEALLIGPDALAAMRQQAEEDAAFGVPDLAKPVEEREVRPTYADVDALAACVEYKPAQVIPATVVWDKAALVALSKVNPTAASFAATIVRTRRLEVR